MGRHYSADQECANISDPVERRRIQRRLAQRKPRERLKRRLASSSQENVRIPMSEKLPAPLESQEPQQSQKLAAPLKQTSWLERSDTSPPERTDGSDKSVRVHTYYEQGPSKDGFYHCPLEGTSECSHQPVKHRYRYKDFVDSHLKPYYCSHRGCHYSRPGNGFSRQWNLDVHIRNLHGTARDLKQGTNTKTRRTTGRMSKALPKVAGQLRAATNNWGKDETERLMQFERQGTNIRIQDVDEIYVPADYQPLVIKCILFKDEKLVSMLGIYSILTKACKNFDPLNMRAMIKSLGIRPAQSITIDQHKELFEHNTESQDGELYRWTDLGPILGKALR